MSTDILEKPGIKEQDSKGPATIHVYRKFDLILFDNNEVESITAVCGFILSSGKDAKPPTGIYCITCLDFLANLRFK